MSAVPAQINPRPERLIVASNVPALDTGMFDHMTRIAKLMAASSLVPAHLNSVRKVGGEDINVSEGEAIANCFLVVNQAVRWGMDPFAVAQGVFVHKGKIGYEGKLVAAVVNTHSGLERRLSYKFEGEGEKRKVTVSGRLKGDTEDKTVDGTVDRWKTSNDAWTRNTDQMLSYRGAREWARRHLPEAILGVHADDDLEFEAGGAQPDPNSGATGAATAAAAASNSGGTGASALKAGLRAAAAGADDAQVVEPGKTEGGATTTTGKPTDGAEEKDKKPAGTLELQEKFLRAFAICMDIEVFHLKQDEVRMYEWTPEDLQVLQTASEARAAVLARSLPEHAEHVKTLSSLEDIANYSESIPEQMRADERYSKAVAARLKEINRPGKK